MRVIIVGCGRMGAGLALLMDRRGHSVTVVDKDATALDALSPSFKGQATVGEGFDRQVLSHAGIEQADGLAAVTNSDDCNAVIARLAREVFKVPRVVARLYDPRKGEIYRRLGLQVVAQMNWGINRTADLLCYSPLDSVLSLGGGEVEIVSAQIQPLLAGRTVSELTIPGEIQVITIERNGRAFLPSLQTVFRKEDVVHLAVLVASAGRLEALFALT